MELDGPKIIQLPVHCIATPALPAILWCWDAFQLNQCDGERLRSSWTIDFGARLRCNQVENWGCKRVFTLHLSDKWCHNPRIQCWWGAYRVLLHHEVLELNFWICERFKRHCRVGAKPSGMKRKPKGLEKATLPQRCYLTTTQRENKTTVKVENIASYSFWLLAFLPYDTKLLWGVRDAIQET